MELDPKQQRTHDSKFKQQALHSFQPVMTSRKMMPVFFAIGIAFVILGGVLHYLFYQMMEHKWDYTECKDLSNTGQTCAEFFENKENINKTCKCEKMIKLEKQFDKSVNVYYGLTNFYQNHRRYVRSRDNEQLSGKDLKPEDLDEDCDPYRIVTVEGQVYGYAPCGSIANTKFNDSFTITYLGRDDEEEVGLLKTGIAWATDQNVKFNNPTSWVGFKKPINWAASVCELDNSTCNTGYDNEDLIVWMRTAAMPNFRKLYRRVDHTGTFADGLPAGKYRINVDYNYPVTSFDGTKFVLIATTSWFGGKNPFLGIAYMVIGAICVLIGCTLILSSHFKVSKESVIEHNMMKVELPPKPLRKLSSHSGAASSGVGSKGASAVEVA